MYNIMTYLLKTVKSHFAFRHIVQFQIILYVYFYLHANHLYIPFPFFVKKLSFTTILNFCLYILKNA